MWSERWKRGLSESNFVIPNEGRNPYYQNSARDTTGWCGSNSPMEILGVQRDSFSRYAGLGMTKTLALDFAQASGFSFESAQIEKLRPTHSATADVLDLVDNFG